MNNENIILTERFKNLQILFMKEHLIQEQLKSFNQLVDTRLISMDIKHSLSENALSSHLTLSSQKLLDYIVNTGIKYFTEQHALIIDNINKILDSFDDVSIDNKIE